MNQKQKKRFRAIGHTLKPVVTVAGNGLSETVVKELNRALEDHELIKIRIVGDRDDRKAVTEEISNQPDTEIVQSIGGVLLVYRPAREPNPNLSNILRADVFWILVISISAARYASPRRFRIRPHHWALIPRRHLPLPCQPAPGQWGSKWKSC